MDKEMSRKILFDKKSVAPEPAAKKPMAQKKEPKKEEPVPRLLSPSKKQITLLEWLEAHDLIKIRTLCLKAGIDPGSFHRWMNVTKKIPQQAIDKITPILQDYGY